MYAFNDNKENMKNHFILIIRKKREYIFWVLSMRGGMMYVSNEPELEITGLRCVQIDPPDVMFYVFESESEY